MEAKEDIDYAHKTEAIRAKTGSNDAEPHSAIYDAKPPA